MTLRAMVLGAGSAGEGHARALRQAGAEVVAIARPHRPRWCAGWPTISAFPWRQPNGGRRSPTCAQTSSPSPRPVTATWK